MADPTKPDIDYSYTGFQQSQQDFPFPGTQLDNDLAELKRGVDDTIDALKDVRRSDGKLKNGLVTTDSMQADLKADFERVIEVVEELDTASDEAVAAAAAAAASQTAAASSASGASTSAAAAAASASTAAAAVSAAGLPAPAASTMLRRNAGNTGYDARTFDQVREDLSMFAANPPEGFNLGKTHWTNSRTGAPDSVATTSSEIVTNATLGACLRLAGLDVTRYLKKVYPAFPGAIYEVALRGILNAAPTDGTMTVRVMAVSLDASYALVGSVVTAIAKVDATTAAGAWTATVRFGATADTDRLVNAWTSGAKVLRFGVYAVGTSEAGSPELDIASFTVREVSNVSSAAGRVSLLNFGEPDRTGSTSATSVFQAALNATSSGKVLRVHVPSGTYNLATTPTAGFGTVEWDLAPGVSFTGAGTLPFHQKTMPVQTNEIAQGKRRTLWHGSYTNPMTDGGTNAVEVLGRVDATAGADNNTYLLHTRLTALIRTSAATGWMQADKVYVEDRSASADTQSVGHTSTILALGAGTVWAYYSESAAVGAGSSAVGCELDVSNWTGTDYTYNETNPTAAPCTKGLWIGGIGNNANSFAMGITAATTAKFGTGLYVTTVGITKYLIDCWATPDTQIRLKGGANNVGIDFGQGATYGSGNGKGAMNLWTHPIKLGSSGELGIGYNTVTGKIEFTKNGTAFISMDPNAAHRNV